MTRDYSETTIQRSSDNWRVSFSDSIAYREDLTVADLESMDLDHMTPSQLEMVATRLLTTDRRERAKEVGKRFASRDGVLNPDNWKFRRRVEYSVADIAGTTEDIKAESNMDRPGVIRNAGQSPMFSRTHPKGRRTNSRKERTEDGKAFYK